MSIEWETFIGIQRVAKRTSSNFPLRVFRVHRLVLTVTVTETCKKALFHYVLPGTGFHLLDEQFRFFYRPSLVSFV